MPSLPTRGKCATSRLTIETKAVPKDVHIEVVAKLLLQAREKCEEVKVVEPGCLYAIDNPTNDGWCRTVRVVGPRCGYAIDIPTNDGWCNLVRVVVGPGCYITDRVVGPRCFHANKRV